MADPDQVAAPQIEERPSSILVEIGDGRSPVGDSTPQSEGGHISDWGRPPSEWPRPLLRVGKLDPQFGVGSPDLRSGDPVLEPSTVYFEVVHFVRRFLGFPRASYEVPNRLPS